MQSNPTSPDSYTRSNGKHKAKPRNGDKRNLANDFVSLLPKNLASLSPEGIKIAVHSLVGELPPNHWLKRTVRNGRSLELLRGACDLHLSEVSLNQSSARDYKRAFKSFYNALMAELRPPQ